MAANGRSALVVDDDKDIRAMLRFILTRYGYTVDAAADGNAALAKLRASSDRLVVVLDMVMPGAMSGVQVLEAVVADATLTCHAYIAHSADNLPTPAVADLLTRLQAPFLLKPFSLDQMLAALATAEERLS
jgi:CheY-like chemotaxis protein